MKHRRYLPSIAIWNMLFDNAGVLGDGDGPPLDAINTVVEERMWPQKREHLRGPGAFGSGPPHRPPNR